MKNFRFFRVEQILCDVTNFLFTITDNECNIPLIQQNFEKVVEMTGVLLGKVLVNKSIRDLRSGKKEEQEGKYVMYIHIHV